MSATVYRGQPTLRSRLETWLSSKRLYDEFDSAEVMRVLREAQGVCVSPRNVRRAHVLGVLHCIESRTGRIRRLNRDRANSREAARWVVAW